MALPKVKEECVLAVLQKAMHTATMDQWAFEWLAEFAKEQPALTGQFAAWIEGECDELDDHTVNSMAAMVGIIVKSIESQIESDELERELGE